MASGLPEGNSLACNAGNSNKPLFMDVNADEELETTEVESLCMQCGKSVRLTQLLHVQLWYHASRA